MLIENRGMLDKWIECHKGREVVLSVKLFFKTRSKDQNAYYWKVVVPMVQEAINEYGSDYSIEETHEFLKKEFNYEERELREGYYVKVPLSTSRLDTVEFSIYKERIQQFGSEVLGIYIPDPNEVLEANQKEEQC